MTGGRAAGAALALALAAGVGNVAWANTAPSSFADSAVEGGGGGRYFTGSPRDRFTCDVCHTGGAAPRVSILTDPPGPTPWGSSVVVSISAEVESLGIVAEVTDDEGRSVGTLSPLPVEALDAVELCGSGLPAATLQDEIAGRQIAAMSPCGAQRLRFEWTTPPTPPTSAVLHVAAVSSDESMDAEGDGVAVVTVDLLADPLDDQDAAVACRVAPRGAGSPTRWVGWLGLLGAIRALRWRRRR